MKKLLVCSLVILFSISVVAAVFARTLEEEKTAVRDYLKVIDAKIIKYRNAGNTAKMKQLQGEKKATLARWDSLKAQMEAEQVAPAPVAPAPAPAPAPVVSASAANPGLFGWGIDTDISIGDVMGNSLLYGRANIVFEDPMALASIVGLKADSIKWKLGLGGAMGNSDADVSMKAIPLYFDGVLNLPADWFGGVETYIGGGLNYVLYGSGSTSGRLGGEAYVGLQGDLGMGGKSFVELGYGVVRSNTMTAKGLSIALGQSIKL